MESSNLLEELKGMGFAEDLCALAVAQKFSTLEESIEFIIGINDSTGNAVSNKQIVQNVFANFKMFEYKMVLVVRVDLGMSPGMFVYV